MRGALSALVLGAAAAAQDAPDADPVAGHAWITLHAEPNPCMLQQQLRLRLQVGIAEEFLRAQMVQLFQRPLDVPVQVETKALRAVEGMGWRGEFAPAGTGTRRLTLALDDRILAAPPLLQRGADGRQFVAFTFELVCLPMRSGVILLPPPRLLFAHATRFEEDFVRGRVALDRQDAVLQAEPATVLVEPWPETGRPPGFVDAVGQFSMSGKLLGQQDALLQLELTIRGSGNLETLSPPPLDALPGFHVLGRVDERSASEYRCRYELLALRPDLTELPAIPLAYLDPGPPRQYRRVETAALALPRASVSAGPAATADVRGLKQVPGTTESLAKPRTPAYALWPALLGPWLLAAALLGWKRARRRARPDPEQERARQAAGRFEARLAAAEQDPAGALAEYLEARLRCAPACVAGPALIRRLGAAGIGRELAIRASSELETLAAARYGGSLPPDAAARARALVAELEQGFAAAGADPRGQGPA